MTVKIVTLTLEPNTASTVCHLVIVMPVAITATSYGGPKMKYYKQCTPHDKPCKCPVYAGKPSCYWGFRPAKRGETGLLLKVLTTPVNCDECDCHRTKTCHKALATVTKHNFTFTLYCTVVPKLTTKHGGAIWIVKK
jgi:hypothetical protein